MNLNKFKRLSVRGFTLYEVAFITAIVGTILAGFTYNYQRYLDQQRFNSDFEQIVSLVRDAHTKTVSSFGGVGGTNVRRYGIYFGSAASAPPNYVALFYGDTYNVTSVLTDEKNRKKELFLHSTVEISSVILPSAGTSGDNPKTIFFKLISGNIEVKQDAGTFTPIGSAGGAVVVRSKNTGVTRTIKLLSTGLIEITN